MYQSQSYERTLSIPPRWTARRAPVAEGGVLSVALLFACMVGASSSKGPSRRELVLNGYLESTFNQYTVGKLKRSAFKQYIDANPESQQPLREVSLKIIF